jgi:hypothetical protein
MLSRPHVHSAAGRIKSVKTPMAPSGIEHATFGFVVQCLSQMRDHVPRSDKKAHIISRGTRISQVEYETSWNEDLELILRGSNLGRNSQDSWMVH